MCVASRRGAAAPASDLSAHQLVRAVVDTGAAQVMVLPNGYVAVEELVAGCTAAIGWGVDVVRCRRVDGAGPGRAGRARPGQSGGRRRLHHGPGRRAARHGSVRIATETALTWAGTCKPGDGLGIAGDEVLIVADDVAAAAIGLVDLLLAPGGNLVTVLIGAGIDDDERIARLVESLEKHMHDHHPGTELVIYRTGHRGDALLIGVE
ncbi:dihydroxyacetone kinase family protein [Mycobacterium ulcerans str. Harvey]|uniref:Dihydroxyacetone kinase family protein n=1 Tax=Mycobacterium ulcerans str. Harvey TaxID=1299332 RepID=A0ABP3ALB9_MYCUL|nr:dihydroxyacetone kinase family protein [Mycobacterium ulcerans str. Harvey]